MAVTTEKKRQLGRQLEAWVEYSMLGFEPELHSGHV